MNALKEQKHLVKNSNLFQGWNTVDGISVFVKSYSAKNIATWINPLSGRMISIEI